MAGNPYDTAGNMISWNGNSYSYGPFNETWRVATSNQEWVHVYTADDERLLSYQVVGGVKRRWTLRGLDNRVLREYVFDQSTSTGVVERDNIYRGSGPLLAAATPAGDRHYHVDHLGTPRQITDATGAQVAFHTYYPYGEEATSPTQDTVRFKFTGHERDLADPTTTQDDLDHMHARMTNPKLGRFLSVDPVGGSPASPQSWNRYTYVAGNPLKYVDPTGEWFLPWEALDAWSYQQSSQQWAAAATEFATNPGWGTGIVAASALIVATADGASLALPVVPALGGVAQRGLSLFDVVPYGKAAAGFEKHHGVLDVWAAANIPGYASRGPAAPAVLLSPELHAAANSAFRSWRKELTGSITGKIDWTKISSREVQGVAEKMFDAANVPKAARDRYYQAFHEYIYADFVKQR